MHYVFIGTRRGSIFGRWHRHRREVLNGTSPATAYGMPSTGHRSATMEREPEHEPDPAALFWQSDEWCAMGVSGHPEPGCNAVFRRQDAPSGWPRYAVRLADGTDRWLFRHIETARWVCGRDLSGELVVLEPAGARRWESRRHRGQQVRIVAEALATEAHVRAFRLQQANASVAATAPARPGSGPAGNARPKPPSASPMNEARRAAAVARAVSLRFWSALRSSAARSGWSARVPRCGGRRRRCRRRGGDAGCSRGTAVVGGAQAQRSGQHDGAVRAGPVRADADDRRGRELRPPGSARESLQLRGSGVPPGCVGSPDYFASHAWGGIFVELVTSLIGELEGAALDDTRVWLACLRSIKTTRAARSQPWTS